MLLLAILDGWGLSDEDKKNAVLHARTPFMDYLWAEFPGRRIFAHGEYVGLPPGQMGNSEVGHLNIGGGRTVRPDLVLINGFIDSGEFQNNKTLVDLVAKVGSRGGRLHLMGLLSDGGIHSHIKHLEALVDLIDTHGPVDTFLHAYLDGRDTEPKVADKFIAQAQSILDSHRDAFFRTIGGRSWGMDRDKNWERIRKHFDAIVYGRAEYQAESAAKAISMAFSRDETDEFVTPTVICQENDRDGRILDGDGVIHFNFRTDRGIQMTSALTSIGFTAFDVSDRPEIDMVTFTMYDEYLHVGVAFEGDILADTLVDAVLSEGKKVFKIAETEKWAHVTKFFNGGKSDQLKGEERMLVQSPIEVRPHYDKKPQMSAYEITENLIQRIRDRKDDLIVVNYANPDMVGHTGVFEAAVTAVETVDSCVARVFDTIREVDGAMIITADHGNCEEMVDDKGEPATKHTINPVPFIVLDRSLSLRDGEGSLKDIAPTILKLMGIAQPEAMTGISLVL